MNEQQPTTPTTQEASPGSKKKSPVRKAIAFILFLLAGVVVVFAGIVAVQPDDFRIVRATTISAPPGDVFKQVNDFHNWEAWSPWAKLDPTAKNSFEGPSSGTGAIFKWSGNDEVGEGKMTLTESHLPDSIAIKLEFVRPFA